MHNISICMWDGGGGIISHIDKNVVYYAIKTLHVPVRYMYVMLL